MTQDEIIEMARQAGIRDSLEYDHMECNAKSLEAFAKLVAKKQAEKCAFLCEELWRKGGWNHNAGFAANCIKKRFL